MVIEVRGALVVFKPTSGNTHPSRRVLPYG